MNRNQFWLTGAPFSKIEPHVPTDTRGKARVDDRRVISGIVQVLMSGGRWADAPADYGPRKTLYNRYVRWAAKGVWVGSVPHACSGQRVANRSFDRQLRRQSAPLGTSSYPELRAVSPDLPTTYPEPIGYLTRSLSH